MPNVVIDTSVSLPATLSPTGVRRRFWVVLALGALSYEVEHGRLELDALSTQAEQEGGDVGGIANALARLERAGDRRAALLERLPYGTPEDWVAIGSRPLFDEYERKLREIGTKLDPALGETDIPRLRRQLEAVCVLAASPFQDADVPALTADRKDDPILYTALVGDADLLVSSDKHLVPDREQELWEHDGHTVLALTFETLLADRLDDVAWDQIVASDQAALLGGRAITVAAAVTTQRQAVYLAVTVRHPAGRPLTLVGYPSFVGAPSIETGSFTPAGEAVADAAVVEVAKRVIRNYLSRSAANLKADLSADAVITLPTVALSVESVDQVTWVGSPGSGAVLVTVTAGDSRGASYTLAYELGIAYRERPYVDFIEVIPTSG